ncbi:MAG: cyclic nucleotide-binding domain-containing protein, partial [Rhodopila sp.]
MSVTTAVAAKPAQAPSQMPWMTSAFCDDSIGGDVGPSGSVLHFSPDRAIYEEGDPARSFNKVVSGVVRTCRFLSDGRRQIDAFYVEGDVFGFEIG